LHPENQLRNQGAGPQFVNYKDLTPFRKGAQFYVRHY
jgi:hypothetical protein